MRAPALTCREAVEFLVEYLAGECDPTERAAFDAHLADCDECVAYIRRYEETVRLGKAAFDATDEPAERLAPDRLVAAILAARHR